jgi:SAM-dependent methyltransferase
VNIQELFALGMKRELGELVTPQGLVVNLGAGNSVGPWTAALDLPEWNAETDPIPYADDTVDGIYAFHFLEHLRSEHVVRMLREIQRVLKVGGTLTVVVPHRLGAMAFQDIDHKSFWTEETWRTLFRNPHYDKNREEPWRLEVKFNMIAGIVERNLCLMTQMVKV